MKSYFLIFYFQFLFKILSLTSVVWASCNLTINKDHTNEKMLKLRFFVEFALEKWKDIGFSYNHSRTMVSQISIADQDITYRPQPRQGKNRKIKEHFLDYNFLVLINHLHHIFSFILEIKACSFLLNSFIN